MTESKIAEKEAAHGKKMIEVKIRFFTDDIASEKGKIMPRHAWTTGVVRMERNEVHDIKPGTPKPFNSLLELGAAIEKVLIEHGITLHLSSKMRRYLD